MNAIWLAHLPSDCCHVAMFIWHLQGSGGVERRRKPENAENGTSIYLYLEKLTETYRPFWEKHFWENYELSSTFRSPHEVTHRDNATNKVTPRHPEVTPPAANHHGAASPKSLIKLCDIGLESRRAFALCQMYVLKISICWSTGHWHNRLDNQVLWCSWVIFLCLFRRGCIY